MYLCLVLCISIHICIIPWFVCICLAQLYKYVYILAAAAKSRQSCPTLCDPIDGSPPGPPILGILQERTLEWIAISFSNVWKWKVKVKSLSHVRLPATPWTAAYQAPPSLGFSRKEYWSGLPLPSPYIGYVHTNMFTCEYTRVVYGCLGCAIYSLGHSYYSLYECTALWGSPVCDIEIGDTVKAPLVGTILLSGGNTVQEL